MMAVGCKTEPVQDLPPIAAKPEVRPAKPEVRGRLRVTNIGSEAIRELDVMFPRDTGSFTGSEPIWEPERARAVIFPDHIVSFGTIQPGATTEYHDAPTGVFRYAAFAYTQDDRRMHQGVTDWVGAKPEEGSFTYSVRFAPVELGRGLIRRLLVIDEVIHDSP